MGPVDASGFVGRAEMEGRVGSAGKAIVCEGSAERLADIPGAVELVSPVAWLEVSPTAG